MVKNIATVTLQKISLKGRGMNYSNDISINLYKVKLIFLAKLIFGKCIIVEFVIPIYYRCRLYRNSEKEKYEFMQVHSTSITSSIS
jgi:hypothetical protein